MQFDRTITIVVIVIVIILTAVFFVVPEYKTFTQLQNELGKKKAEFNAQFEYYASITRTHVDLQEMKEDLVKVDDALPQDNNLGETVYLLQQTAGESGMMVKSVLLSKSGATAKSKSASTASVKDVIFSVDLLGDYFSLENFIALLEKSSRFFEVTNISFGAGAGSSSASSTQSQFQTRQIYNFNLQVKTHSY